MFNDLRKENVIVGEEDWRLVNVIIGKVFFVQRDGNYWHGSLLLHLIHHIVIFVIGVKVVVSKVDVMVFEKHEVLQNV